MNKLFSAVKKYALPAVACLALLAVLGVGYFDTYPTYFAKTVTLSETECGQVAVLVAAHEYKKQNPNEALPDSAAAVLKDVTRLSKRVAQYIIDKGIVDGQPPSYIAQGLYQSCLMAGGVAELK